MSYRIRKPVQHVLVLAGVLSAVVKHSNFIAEQCRARQTMALMKGVDLGFASDIVGLLVP